MSSGIPDELKSKLKARDELYAQLDRSLLLQSWWPEAFASGGSVKSCWIGSSARGFRFRVTRSDGVVREVSQADAPEFAGSGPRYENGEVIS